MASREVLIALKLIGADKVEAGLTKVSQAVAKMGQHIDTVTKSSGQRLEEMGRNMQRTGRVLSVELTAPIVAFGKVAVDKFVEVDTATRQLQKVFSGTAKQLNSQLIPAAQELAVGWGMNKVEILDVMQELAAMGFTVTDIIDGTTRAIEVSKLGNLDLARSMDLVVAVMQNYNVRGKELEQTIADINAVEDAGAARLSDFSVGLGRVASVGKLAGLSIKEVGAMMSVLVGRGEQATIAARALRTTFSRIMSPTEAIKEEFGRLGVNIEKTESVTKTLTRTIGGNSDEVERLGKKLKSASEKLRDYLAYSEEADISDEDREKQVSKLTNQIEAYKTQIAGATGVTEEYIGTVNMGTGEMKSMDEILKELAVEWKDMTGLQQANTATIIAGRHHVDRFVKVMDDLASETSDYDRIIKETSDDTENMSHMLNTLTIESNSAATQFGRLNARFDEFKEFVGRDIVPIIIPLIDGLLQVANRFKNLDESTRSFIIKAAMILAALGPLLIAFGLMVQGIGAVKLAFASLTTVVATKLIPALMFLVANPLVALFAAATAAGVALGILIIKSDVLKTKADLVAEAQGRQAESQRRLTELMDIANQKAIEAEYADLRLESAKLRADKATRDLSLAIQQYGQDSDQTKEATLLYRGAQLELESAERASEAAAEDLQTADFNMMKQQDETTKKTLEMRDAIEQQETAWGNLTKKIGGAISKLGEWIKKQLEVPEAYQGSRHQNFTPSHQHGGIVDGPIGAPVPIIAHGGERVVPRSGVDVNGGVGGGAVNINFNGNVSIDSEDRVRQLADQVGRILGRQNELSRYGAGY